MMNDLFDERSNNVATQAVERRQSFIPATAGGFGEGMEGLDQQDLILPRKTILQPTSKKDGKEGEFFDNLTNQCVPHIDAVALRISRTRTLWSGDLSDTRPECQSYDAVNGSAYGACDACEFNSDVNRELWDQAGLKRCNRGYLFLCVNTVDDSLFLLGAMGTSVRPAKVLISQLVQRRGPAFGAVIRFETAKVVDDKGKYYVLKPSIAKALAPAEVAGYRERFQQIQGVAIHDIDDGTEPEGDAPPF